MNFADTRKRPTIAQVAIAVPACVLLLVAVFVPAPFGMRGQALCAVLNFAHFLLAAGACWYLWAWRGWPGWAAFASVVAAAALCEFVQSFTGRCPATSDFFRGVFGALAASICLATFRPLVPATRWIGATVAVVAVSAWPISEFLFAAARFCIRATSSIG